MYNTNADIVTTPLLGSNGSFFIVRHSDFTSQASTNYTLSLPTSAGTVSIPQLGGSLSLNGRDSKVHVTDYPVGDSKLLYSTAEIFTWQVFDNKTVLIVYGGPNELHELAILSANGGTMVEGDGVTIQQTNNSVVAQWQTSADRRIVQFGDLFVYILGKSQHFELPSKICQTNDESRPQQCLQLLGHRSNRWCCDCQWTIFGAVSVS